MMAPMERRHPCLRFAGILPALLTARRLSRKEFSIANPWLSGKASPALYFPGDPQSMKREKISELTTNRLSV
ncbi:MAG TPA: hypothetical protein VK475_03040, partial [Pyrinomonadaceae bacterium]|nr:hypothetical protein [Pyrinomonadaceae bacterium]